MNVLTIDVGYDNREETMWGMIGSGGYVIEASETRFEQMVAATLKAEFPESDITVSAGHEVKISLNDEGAEAALKKEVVRDIMGMVWQGFQWTVKEA